MVEVTEEEVKNSVKLIPSWTTVVRGGGAFLSSEGLRGVWPLPETRSVLDPVFRRPPGQPASVSGR